MNKEVIKKYREVFDYWLDGGDIWYKKAMNEWRLITSHSWSWEGNGTHVQDDMYADLRKAQVDLSLIHI